MKIILIILLVFIIMLIAKAVSEQYKDKFDFYDNLYQFLGQFKLNLTFKQEKVVEFLENLKPKKQFSLFIDDYQNYLNNNELNFDNLTFLDKEEKENLTTLIVGIGKHDINTEIEQVNGLIEITKLKKNQAEQDKNKICPLIIKLSLLFAIGLAILLI